MDERTMIDVPDLPLPLALTACFLGGVLLGLAYFRALRVTADLIARGGSAVLATALTLGRLALLCAGFFIAARVGALALLAALLGVLVAKGLMVRRVRGQTT